MSGHRHDDYVSEINNIPVILTQRVTMDSSINMDLCYADFDNGYLHCVRVGEGESRDIQIISNVI
jgi:hypothetical protein